MPALIEALKQTDGISRYNASQYLGTSEARHIAAAIAKIGPDAIPSLAKAIASEKQHIASAASVSLQSIEKIEVAIPTLIESLKDEKAEAWRQQVALTLIGKIGKPANAAIPVVLKMLKMLKSNEWQNRRALIDCIQKIGESPAEVVEILIEMAKGESTKRTSEARLSPVQPVSYPGWKQENSDQHWALDQLAFAGEKALPAIPTLVELLHAANSQTRRRAAATIGEIGPKANAALPALQRAHRLDYHAVNLIEFEDRFRTDQACRANLEELRWPKDFGARCQHGTGSHEKHEKNRLSLVYCAFLCFSWRLAGNQSVLPRTDSQQPRFIEEATENLRGPEYLFFQ